VPVYVEIFEGIMFLLIIALCVIVRKSTHGGQDEPWRPVCHECGAKMIRVETGPYYSEWRCPNVEVRRCWEGHKK